MKERPILFSAPMVRALLDGSKTQTRRVVKPQPSNGWKFEAPPVFGRITSPHPKQGRFGVFIRHGVGTDFPQVDLIPCPYGQPGDRLWVRETWAYGIHALSSNDHEAEGPWVYAADNPKAHGRLCDRWRPSIHMFRPASRITLEITSVRVERLKDISRGDAMAEGCPFPNMAKGDDPRQWYTALWEQINGEGSWKANPWVWVVEFKKVAP